MGSSDGLVRRRVGSLKLAGVGLASVLAAGSWPGCADSHPMRPRSTAPRVTPRDASLPQLDAGTLADGAAEGSGLDVTCPEGGCAAHVGPCLTTDDVLYLVGAGDTFDHPDGEVSVRGTWAVELSEGRSDFGELDTLHFVVTNDSDAGSPYRLVVSTDNLGRPLAEGVYEPTDEYGSHGSTGKPLLEVRSTTTVPLHCRGSVGSFRVLAMERDEDQLEVLAHFTYYCDDDVEQLVRGCVHYDGLADVVEGRDSIP